MRGKKIKTLKPVTAVTLVELVMVMVITALVMLSFSGYIKQAVDTWDYLSYRSDILSDARLELVRMGRSIRALSANSIFTADSNVFGFSSNNNGVPVYMRYRYDASSNTVLYEESNSSGGPFTSYPFMNNVDNAATTSFFNYLDANMASTNNTSVIRYIQIKPRFNNRGQTMSIDYDVSPRNLH